MIGINPEILENRLVEIDLELSSLDNQIKKLYDGQFFISKNGQYEKWYYYKNGKQHYIPKINRPLAEELAERKYLSSIKDRLLAESKAINSYLKHYNSSQLFEQGLLSNKAYQDLLASKYSPLSDELATWAKADYPTNQFERNNCVYHCLSGDVVRSKSEMNIDQGLFFNKIPFRYEAELDIMGSKKYPDFTIRHPVTGAFYYWEHLGYMHNESYRIKNMHKINDYMSIGIYPGKNLILTFENKGQFLDAKEVDKIIHFYFGNE